MKTQATHDIAYQLADELTEGKVNLLEAVEILRDAVKMATEDAPAEMEGHKTLDAHILKTIDELRDYLVRNGF